MSDRAGAMKTFGEYSSEREAVNTQKIEVHQNKTFASINVNYKHCHVPDRLYTRCCALQSKQESL